jgi:hypothetical protein
MNNRRTRQSGSAMVEFALIGIPLMFTLLITFELSRAMWAYHTVAYAVKEGVRFAVVHGNNCATVPNNCLVTRAQIAARIGNAGLGLIRNDLQIAFGTAGTLAPIATYDADPARFPTAAAGARFLPIEIRAEYTFRSPLGRLLTAGGPGTYVFPASSQELVQY